MYNTFTKLILSFLLFQLFLTDAVIFKCFSRVKENPNCAICQDEIEHNRDALKIPPCNHKYHKECINTWLKQKNTCPYCRATIPAEHLPQEYFDRNEENVPITTIGALLSPTQNEPANLSSNEHTHSETVDVQARIVPEERRSHIYFDRDGRRYVITEFNAEQLN
uniref:RING-type domain-containing protein n=1 Tax=Globodera rostochiensis TaxID=31243 RepID=A0A914HNH7_GLORO